MVGEDDVRLRPEQKRKPHTNNKSRNFFYVFSFLIQQWNETTTTMTVAAAMESVYEKMCMNELVKR